MVYDSAATRARLLEAAHAEFVAHGLAGARVERIAKAASANKQGIYAYFGSKEALFDAVLTARFRGLTDMVPFTPGDLGAWAGALFDAYVADPDMVRLSQWKDLERPEASPDELKAHMFKAEALADACGTDRETALDALMITLSAARTWSATPAAIRNPQRSDETERRNRHRSAVVTAVTAMADRLISLQRPG
jgi:AcrR family transcriptional regulator